MEQQQVDTTSDYWSSTGLSFLLMTLAIFLFKTAPAYWPLTLVAFLGSTLIRLAKKRGLVVSYILLVSAMTKVFFAASDLFWLSLLSLSIMISWWLIYTGVDQTENRDRAAAEEKLERTQLEEQLRIAKLNIESQTTQLNALQEQHQQMAEALEKTTQELKSTEHEWLCLQKLYEQQSFEPVMESAVFSQNLSQLEEERQELETQVAKLEEIISSLLVTKKAPPKRRAENTQVHLF